VQCGRPFVLPSGAIIVRPCCHRKSKSPPCRRKRDEDGAPSPLTCTGLRRFAYFRFGVNGDGRGFAADRFAPRSGVGAQTSPDSVVWVTFKKLFGLATVPVPVPNRTPAQASLIVLPVTVLLLPLPQLSSTWMPDWALP